MESSECDSPVIASLTLASKEGSKLENKKHKNKRACPPNKIYKQLFFKKLKEEQKANSELASLAQTRWAELGPWGTEETL
jgi:hypothetical protein